MEIFASQLGVASRAMNQIGIGPSEIAAIGITNQRETTIVWDKETGEPVYPAIVLAVPPHGGTHRCVREDRDREEQHQRVPD